MCNETLRKFAKFTYNFVKNEILARVFSYEFCVISKNTFLTKHRGATAYVYRFISITLHDH